MTKVWTLIQTYSMSMIQKKTQLKTVKKRKGERIKRVLKINLIDKLKSVKSFRHDLLFGCPLLGDGHSLMLKLYLIIGLSGGSTLMVFHNLSNF